MSPIKGFSCIDVGTEPLYVDTVILITLFTNYCTHPFGTEVQKIFDNLIISGTSFTTSALTCDEVPSAIRAALLEAARRNKNPNEPSYSKYFLDADPSILKQVDEISFYCGCLHTQECRKRCCA